MKNFIKLTGIGLVSILGALTLPQLSTTSRADAGSNVISPSSDPHQESGIVGPEGTTSETSEVTRDQPDKIMDPSQKTASSDDQQCYVKNGKLYPSHAKKKYVSPSS